MNTLVLNASYEPLRTVSLERALYYLMTGKAEIVEAYDRVIRSVSLTLQHPKVIKLVKYVKLKRKYKGIKYSKKNVLIRDNNTCQYCGIRCSDKTATLDHVIPKSRGGGANWTNIVIACHPCNNSKDNRTPKEANMVLLKVPVRPEGLKFMP